MRSHFAPSTLSGYIGVRGGGAEPPPERVHPFCLCVRARGGGVRRGLVGGADPAGEFRTGDDYPIRLAREARKT